MPALDPQHPISSDNWDRPDWHKYGQPNIDSLKRLAYNEWVAEWQRGRPPPTISLLYSYKYMNSSTQDDFKDVFYHCVPILNAASSKELSSKLRQYASELYDENPSRLQFMVGGNSLTKEKWIRRAQRMVIHPDYDHKEQTTYISIRQCGKCSDRHDEVVDLLAAKLMSKAPKNYPVQKTVVSSEKTDHSKPSPWFIYQDGQLVETDQIDRCWQ
jgi:hypothetical protein